jgi:hypothetical protein
MLYAGSNDAIEKEIENFVHNYFYVKFLGPAQWFLQWHIHQATQRQNLVATAFISIATFSTPYNHITSTWNSLNMKLQST